MEKLHSAAPAEAVGAQARDVNAHSGESVGRQGQEDAAVHALPQVRQTVQAGVLPLPVGG